jgi:hypothetical protein
MSKRYFMRYEPNKRQMFALLTVLFLISRVADAAATYMVTPDLRHETNPVVSVLGAGWNGILVAQVILSALVIGLIYWDLFLSRLPYPAEHGLEFPEFAQTYYFGRKRILLDFLWRPPSGWRLNLKLAGYALPRVLVVLGFSVAASSIASLHSERWRRLLHATSPWIYFVPAVFLAVWSIYAFLRREFRLYNELP